MRGIWPVASAVFLLVLAIVQIPALGGTVAAYTVSAIGLGLLPMLYFRQRYNSPFYQEPSECHTLESAREPVKI
jgi:hypothetical protein